MYFRYTPQYKNYYNPHWANPPQKCSTHRKLGMHTIPQCWAKLCAKKSTPKFTQFIGCQYKYFIGALFWLTCFCYWQNTRKVCTISRKAHKIWLFVKTNLKVFGNTLKFNLMIKDERVSVLNNFWPFLCLNRLCVSCSDKVSWKFKLL